MHLPDAEVGGVFSFKKVDPNAQEVPIFFEQYMWPANRLGHSTQGVTKPRCRQRQHSPWCTSDPNNTTLAKVYEKGFPCFIL